MTRIGLMVIVGALLSSMPISCAGRAPGPELPMTTGAVIIDAYVLYVEEVVLPEVIYENESSEMLWRVSAEANPDVLRGLNADRFFSIYYALYYGAPGDRWMIDACIRGEADPRAEPGDMLPVFLPAHPAGDWSIIVRSAADRSLGGTMCEYMITPPAGPLTPLEDLQETRYTFTVIPRPEE